MYQHFIPVVKTGKIKFLMKRPLLYSVKYIIQYNIEVLNSNQDSL